MLWVIGIKLNVIGVKTAIQEFIGSLAPVTMSGSEGTGVLLQPVIHHSMMNILTTLFEALSSHELVYNVHSNMVAMVM